jgi:hypothetical protein
MVIYNFIIDTHFPQTLVLCHRSLKMSIAVIMFDSWVILTTIFQLNGIVDRFFESVPAVSRQSLSCCTSKHLPHSKLLHLNFSAAVMSDEF